MSKYESTETVMTDPKHLASALQDLGYTPEMHLDQAQPLFGYENRARPELAHIIVRREQVGAASNDLGFVREDGKFRAIISQFDSHRLDKAWLGRLTQSYQEKCQIAMAKTKGYAFLGRKVKDGVVELQFEVR